MEISFKTSDSAVDTIPRWKSSSSLKARIERRNGRSIDFGAESPWAMVLTLLGADILALVGILGLTRAASSSLPEGAVLSDSVIPGIGLLLIAAYGVHGLYSQVHRHPAEEMRVMGAATLIVLGGAAVGLLLLGRSTAAAILGGMAVLGAIVVPGTRVLVRILAARTSWWGLSTVVMGPRDHVETVVDTLERWPELGFRPDCVLHDDGENDDVVSVERLKQILPLAEEEQISCAIVVLPDCTYKERSQLVAHLGKFIQHLIVIPRSLGLQAFWTTRSFYHCLPAQGVQQDFFKPRERWAKRVIDVLGAAAGLFFLMPLFGLITILVKLDSPGPVFFRQRRMTREGRCFTVLKFRTMHENAEERLLEILRSDPERRAEYERYHKLQDDPRVTRVGEWLRQSSLDELPQLWNVLRGEMSLVGPRAYMPGELPKMGGLGRVVLQALPGITGLWQVSGRNKLDFETRVNLDVHYTQNWTFWLDFYILLRTIPAVLFEDGGR